jgi:hypothetical protein
MIEAVRTSETSVYFQKPQFATSQNAIIFILILHLGILIINTIYEGDSAILCYWRA